jgi:hypothetical protein
MAEFTTIYPGWYEGRAIHIHMKVHTGGHVSHTGQLFFPEDVTAKIAQLQPYVKHKDVHLTTQAEDMVFEPQHGAGGLVTLSRIEPRSDAAGFVATVTLAVDPEATPEPVGMGGPRGNMMRNDPRRPVEQISRDLGVSPEQFVACFNNVNPAAQGTRPTSAQVLANKAVLLSCLQKANPSITNEKLDAVMDKYRPGGREAQQPR